MRNTASIEKPVAQHTSLGGPRVEHACIITNGHNAARFQSDYPAFSRESMLTRTNGEARHILNVNARPTGAQLVSNHAALAAATLVVREPAWRLHYPRHNIKNGMQTHTRAVLDMQDV